MNIIPQSPLHVEEALHHRCSHDGHNLADLTHELPIIFVFLRHLGCTFCRESLYEVARQRRAIEMEGSAIALVHMSPPHEADEIFEKYGLKDIIHISDPELALYRAFHLNRGKWYRLMGMKVLIRGFIAGFLRGHGLGPSMGDVAQMPGVFLVHRGEVMLEYRHKSPADRPNYVEIATYPFQIENLPSA
ncbi:MAG: SelL-related redox protein [bacterium]|nr:SelL-related redox protein [bacterium]